MPEQLTVETETLGVIELPFSVVEYELQHDGQQEPGQCRFFSAPRVNGESFDDFVFEFLDSEAEAADEEDQSFFQELRQLLWLDMMVPNKDRRPCRAFNPKTFGRIETLRCLTRATGTCDADLTQQLTAFTTGEEANPSHTFEMALYERPQIHLPVIPEEYASFRQLALGEMAEWVKFPTVGGQRESGVLSESEETH